MCLCLLQQPLPTSEFFAMQLLSAPVNTAVVFVVQNFQRPPSQGKAVLEHQLTITVGCLKKPWKPVNFSEEMACFSIVIYAAHQCFPPLRGLYIQQRNCWDQFSLFYEQRVEPEKIANARGTL